MLSYTETYEYKNHIIFHLNQNRPVSQSSNFNAETKCYYTSPPVNRKSIVKTNLNKYNIKEQAKYKQSLQNNLNWEILVNQS